MKKIVGLTISNLLLEEYKKIEYLFQKKKLELGNKLMPL